MGFERIKKVGEGKKKWKSEKSSPFDSSFLGPPCMEPFIGWRDKGSEGIMYRRRGEVRRVRMLVKGIKGGSQGKVMVLGSLAR